MNADQQQAHETILRLRKLHGVYELALMLAANHLAGSDGSPREEFDKLLVRATKELEEQGTLSGRWSLFTDEEILAVTGTTPMPDELQAEIGMEIARRFPVE